jgi:hypothetical protein
MKTEVRKVCRNVTTYEERTVMKTCYKTVQETCMKKELVRLGHWECREVCASGLFGGGGLLGGGHGHGHGHGDCCEDQCAPQTRTRRVWVHCPEYCERPVTVCKKVCVQVPQVCRVPVCRQVWEEQKVQVCTYQCVTEQRTEKYTVMVPRQVTYKATRTVRVCVPYEETVTCCRMVRRERQIQVPVTECCENPCDRAGLFRGLFGGGGRHGGHGGHGDCCN